MGKNTAEYMRAYRARRKAAAVLAAGAALYAELNKPVTPDEALAEARRYASEYAALSNDLRRDIEQLEEEVRYLKAELANRPPVTSGVGPRIPALDRQTQQTQRDAILRKINRTK